MTSEVNKWNLCGAKKKVFKGQMWHMGPALVWEGQCYTDACMSVCLVHVLGHCMKYVKKKDTRVWKILENSFNPYSQGIYSPPKSLTFRK